MPSDLIFKYTEEGGLRRLEYDLAVLNEIQQQITEARSNDQKDNAAAAHARKEQRRKASDSEVLGMLKAHGASLR